MNAAIEAAARAALETIMYDGDRLQNWLEVMDGAELESAVQFIRPAIIAFLRNCEVSLHNGIFETSDIAPHELKAMFNRMATELEGK